MPWNLKNTYSELPTPFFSRVKPTPVSEPKLILWNSTLAHELGLETADYALNNKTEIFSGNVLPPKSESIAQAYCGHQFGHFNKLGDGRAILLGEQLPPLGKLMDVQLKGSGVTPYSRRGDGRATLSSMLREYLISEAMYFLQIPTTRSLAVVGTGEEVYREEIQEGAVLTRIASSHIRVGTFQYAAWFEQQNGHTNLLSSLLTYTLKRHYPELLQTKIPALAFLDKVMEQQAQLIVNWLRVGFIHGVMNTDNMSISGETIDYGPCAFMNAYHPQTVFSSIDTQGRYAFGNQAEIALWNLTRLAETLIPLVNSDVKTAISLLENSLSNWSTLFEQKWLNMMRQKLGITIPQTDDAILFAELLGWMMENKADYTNTFYYLTEGLSFKNQVLNDHVYESEEFQTWVKKWQKRVWVQNAIPKPSLLLMKNSNPVYIPRNHKVESALYQARENHDLSEINQLLFIFSNCYNYTSPNPEFQLPPIQGDANYKTYCGT